MLNKAREAKPKEAAVYQQLAGFYQRQGEFDKLIAAVQQRAELEPNNPRPTTPSQPTTGTRRTGIRG